MSLATVEPRTATINLPGAGALDRLVSDGGACMRLPRQRQEEVALELIRDAVSHHLAACDLYGRYAERFDFSLDRLQTVADLASVPQLPVGVFKRARVRSVPMGVPTRRCTSSGTHGTVSVIERDDPTLERLLGSVRAAVDGLNGQWREHELNVVNLGPSRSEAGDLWFAYVLSLVELLYPTIHEVVDGVLDLDAVAADVWSLLEEDDADVAIVGPPAFVYDLATHIQGSGTPIPGGHRMHFLTAGGWKRQQGRAVTRTEIDAVLTDAFSLRDTNRVRDAFNQVELNTVFGECWSRRKHVPPWVHVAVRDPSTLAPVPDGEPGLLSYLDATATSYPCFIVTDDIGNLDSDPCPCGVEARTVSVTRRIERDEEWGCARKMDRDTVQIASGTEE